MFLSLILVGAAPQTSQTLDQIGDGKLQCYLPDVEAKTCTAIASYARQPDGSWINVADQLLPIQPQLRIMMKTRVTIEGDTICGPILRNDILQSEFIGPTGKLAPTEALRIAGALADAMAPVLEREICTHYRHHAGSITAEISIDGIRQQSLDETIAWVAPDAGYRPRARSSVPVD